jgi:SAM-dependent methyltransferase
MGSRWVWDKTLFGGSARYDRTGRLPYAPEIATAFKEELDLDGTGRLLDVGSGTGEIALLLAPLYAEVVGLDPDEDMIEEARAEAERQGCKNAPSDDPVVAHASASAGSLWHSGQTVASSAVPRRNEGTPSRLCLRPSGRAAVASSEAASTARPGLPEPARHATPKLAR